MYGDFLRSSQINEIQNRLCDDGLASGLVEVHALDVESEDCMRSTTGMIHHGRGVVAVLYEGVTNFPESSTHLHPSSVCS